MADLDTRSKRASSVQLLVPSTLAPVLPDATLDQGDRQHIALSYSGIAAAAAGGDPEGSLVGGKLLRGGLLRHGVLVRSA